MAAAAASPARVPAEQRVFSLILALVASPNGATKRDLLSSVYGYAERFERGVTDPALERQFERDKEQLRTLGVPIETIDAPLESGNTQLTRYRIAKERLQMPDEVRFDAEELMLMRAAGLAWSEGSLSAEARRAAMKLEALGAALNVEQLGFAPRIALHEPAAPALQAAIDGGHIVRFAYQLPSRTSAMERRVAPLHLHRADGRWHLIAWDFDREAERIFLLSRIQGSVQVCGDPYDANLRGRVADAIARLTRLTATQRATVLVRAGSVAEARLSSRVSNVRTSEHAGDFVSIEFGTLDYHLLAVELAGFGDEVRVLGPETLRDQVVALLQEILTAHAAGDPGLPGGGTEGGDRTDA